MKKPLASLTVLCALGTLVLATLVSPGPAGASTPLQQPFGPAPANIATYPNGAVLKSKSVVTSIDGVPLPAKSWQVQYKSIDNHGEANVYVATILIPKTAWRGTGPRPLVSYQFAEDSVTYRCAPSHILTAGLTALTEAGGEPSGLLTLALLRGWAVVVPDYEGPNSEFGGAAGSAHGVLDGIRAAKNFTTAGISRTAPVGLWGYSGGALATMWAVMSQPTYAPGVKLAGAAAGGTPASLTATAQAFNRIPVMAGAINMAIAGLDRSYPQRHILDYLNDEGRAAVAGSQDTCIFEAMAKYPQTSLERYGLTTAELDQATYRISPLSYPGRPATPVLMYHSILDEAAPIGPARDLATKLCGMGVQVTKVEGILGEHVLYAALAAPTAVNYLADRFAGKPVRSTC